MTDEKAGSRVVTATGVASVSAVPGLGARIQAAMSQAVLDYSAECGERGVLVDHDEMRARMQTARAAARQGA